MLFNPLEQFELKVYYPFTLFGVDISANTALHFLLFAVFTFYFLSDIYFKVSRLIPSGFQYLMESIYILCRDIAKQQIGLHGDNILSILFCYFNFILILNFIGLLPHSLTITSHVFMTFGLGFSAWFGILILAIMRLKLKFLKLFVPSGIPVFLIPLLVIIEVVSYISRVFSLSIRLFANMMSGHTLLNILSSFVFKISNKIALTVALPVLFIVVLVAALEIAIAFLQAYVFTVLTVIYYNDIFNADSH